LKLQAPAWSLLWLIILKKKECIFLPIDFLQYKNFIFDLDGTLLDSSPWHAKAYIETFKKYRSDIYVNEEFIKGVGSRVGFERHGISDEEELKEMINYKREIYLNFINDKKVQPFPEYSV
jgi:beta-phosphoglucomutase-like phosphatase (HAD superfamily)